MNNAIEQLGQIRTVISKVSQSFDGDELFVVPDGFKNNIAWNLGHLIVTQQILHYNLSGLDPHLDASLIEIFRKGTGPEAVDKQAYDAVLQFLPEAPKLLTEDYESGRFKTFSAYVTSAGVSLNNIEAAIIFNNFHEGLHLGYILALRRAIR